MERFKIKEISIKEMRIIQLDMLKKIDSYCRANNIQYSLSQGTLLGAVRHKGFIPWDDDMDIMLTREEYEKFIKGFAGLYTNIIVQTPETDESYSHPYAKIYDNRTVLIDAASKGGVYIDVFPVDGWPNDPSKINYHLESIRKTEGDLAKTTKFYKFMSPKYWLFIKYQIKKLFYPSRKKVLKTLKDKVYQYPVSNSNYVGELFGPYGTKEYYPANIYNKYIDIEFEGFKFMCIADYDIFLSRLYGDYMTLPPENKRKPHHYYDIYWAK